MVHGFTTSQRYGDCDLCWEYKLLGFVDCYECHCCCVSCFINLKNTSGTLVRCHQCREVVQTFYYHIKVEDNESDSTVVINVYD
jgi:hypothetical protein